MAAATMESTIATLSASQILRFFANEARPTQQECDELAERTTGHPTTPARVQGGSSYTVEAGDYVVQFRAPDARLEVEFLGYVEKAYHGFIPCHRDLGILGGLLVYRMRNVGGLSFYLARDS